MFTYAYGKTSGCFADVTGITARTQKFVVYRFLSASASIDPSKCKYWKSLETVDSHLKRRKFSVNG